MQGHTNTGMNVLTSCRQINFSVSHIQLKQWLQHANTYNFSMCHRKNHKIIWQQSWTSVMLLVSIAFKVDTCILINITTFPTVSNTQSCLLRLTMHVITCNLFSKISIRQQNLKLQECNWKVRSDVHLPVCTLYSRLDCFQPQMTMRCVDYWR